MAPRPKPRTSHSKTGCLTCKHRKVKCSEERPRCSRCIQGGFVCKGYIDPPQAWIFYSRNEAQIQNKQTSLPSGTLTTQARRTSSGLPSVRIQSPMKRGNSDPFDALAVPIGPREHDLLQIYERLLVQALYASYPTKIADLLAGIERQTYIGCLRDEAAGYALLSREAALRGLLSLRDGYTEPSISSLNYMVRSQAVLSRRLSLMTGSESPDAVYNLICTISYLATAEVSAASPTAGVHIRALHNLIARYAKLVGPQLLQKAFMSVVPVIFSDVFKAFLGSTRPRIDLNEWLPYLHQFETEKGEPSPSGTAKSDSGAGITHRAVEDETLRSAMLRQRERVRLNYESFHAELSFPEMIQHAITLHKEVMDVNRLLHIVADAEEHLLDRDLSYDRVQYQCARAYVSLAILLWCQLVLPTSLVINLVFNVAALTLNRMKSIILRSQNGEKHQPQLEECHKEARLWALAVGVYVQLHRKRSSGSDIACFDWFIETFRTEVDAIQFHSWQEAVKVFEQFLYNDEVKPHISQWWDQVIFDR